MCHHVCPSALLIFQAVPLVFLVYLRGRHHAQHLFLSFSPFETGFLCSPGSPGIWSVDQIGLELRGCYLHLLSLGLKVCATTAQLQNCFLCGCWKSTQVLMLVRQTLSCLSRSFLTFPHLLSHWVLKYVGITLSIACSRTTG